MFETEKEQKTPWHTRKGFIRFASTGSEATEAREYIKENGLTHQQVRLVKRAGDVLVIVK